MNGAVRTDIVSIHAPLARSNWNEWPTHITNKFQYMLLLRGATSGRTLYGLGLQVSIHAPLARSNLAVRWAKPGSYVFQYMLLLRGATASSEVRHSAMACFNTCSSCEEQRKTKNGNSGRGCFNTCSSCEEQLSSFINHNLCTACFNTCSSCEEQLLPNRKKCTVSRVSIHAPLARSNSLLSRSRNKRESFQYMLLLRGATRGPVLVDQIQ